GLVSRMRCSVSTCERFAISAFTRVFDALWLIRDRYRHRLWNGPGSAVHHFVLHRARDTNRYFPHTSSAISTTSRIFAHCCAPVSTLPSSVEAKPHCGLNAICSIGMNFAASSSRRLTVSLLSSVPLFEVMTPTTTILLPLGRKRSGSKPPARSESYSRKGEHHAALQ